MCLHEHTADVPQRSSADQVEATEVLFCQDCKFTLSYNASGTVAQAVTSKDRYGRIDVTSDVDTSNTSQASRSCLKKAGSWPRDSVRRKVSFADDAGHSLTETFLFSKSELPKPDADDELDDSQNWLDAMLWNTAAACPIVALNETNLLLAGAQPKAAWWYAGAACHAQAAEPGAGGFDLCFEQPIGNSMLNGGCALALATDVALLHVWLSDNCSRINGAVKVRNVAFEKVVFVRITCNAWSSYVERCAAYSSSDVSNTHDIFTWSLEVDLLLPRQYDKLDSSGKIEFCLGYQADSQILWDNNDGKNYHFSLKPKHQKTDFFLPG